MAKKFFEPCSSEKNFLHPSGQVWGHAPPEKLEVLPEII